MEKESFLKISDFAAINNAEIDISRINVIGGVNSSGKTLVSKLLYCCLKSLNGEELNDLMAGEGLANCSRNKVDFKLRTYSDIFYLENIAIMDLLDSDFINSSHIRHVKECLEIENAGKSDEIISKIQEIIERDCSSLSSAGIKQIGVIQILLENGSLNKNSFLIIDEPESNLHHDWQIRFAEILVLLTKELNITLYLNSYSPIFIEAMSLYAQYYGLLESTNFYLTKKQADGRFDFRKINPKNMGEVYEDLTRPYDELDKIKAEILFRE